MNPRYDDMVTALGRWVTGYPWLTVLATLLAVAACTWGAKNLGFSTDYRVFFGPENPQLQAWDEMQNVYTKNDNIIFVVQPPGDTVFTRETMGAVEMLTEQAWTLPYALRVDSLSNYQHTRGENDDLIVAKLIEDAASATPEQLEYARQVALHEPLLVRRLVSPSGHVTGVNVVFQYPGESVTEVPTATAAARELRDRVLEAFPGHTIYMGGSNMMNNAFSEAAKADLATLFPLMYLSIIVLMYLLVRSIGATLAAFGVVVLSAVAAVGVGGWMHILLTPPSVSAPTIITTLAVADSVHLLVSFFANLREGMSKREAMVQALRLNFTAVFLTSVTTALGFLTINLTDSPPLHDLGNITAVGVMIAWLISVTFLPAVCMILPVRAPKSGDGRLPALMEALGRGIVRHRKPVLVFGTVLSLGLVALVPLNETNDLFAHYFDKSIKYRTDTDFMVENLTGLYTMEFNLRAPGPSGVSDPDYLRKLEAFADWWKTQDKVIHVSTISDIFKRLNKNMHGDDPAWYRLPEDRELAAQYLLLYEFSLPFGLDLNNTLNIDKSASRFIVTFEHLKSRETREIDERARAWLAANAPEMETLGVSPAVMFAYIAERNIRSMFLAIPLSLLVISLLLVPALKSWKLGALSIIPNLLPLGIAFGVWGIIDGEINFTMAVVLGMVMGIIVDDTIHFLTKYLRARRELGMGTEDAIAYAFRTVGTALTVTSLILCAGFLILSTSAFLPNGGMAQLTTIAIIAALVADVLLLPPLLMLVDSESTESAQAKLKLSEDSDEPAYVS